MGDDGDQVHAWLQGAGLQSYYSMFAELGIDEKSFPLLTLQVSTALSDSNSDGVQCWGASPSRCPLCRCIVVHTAALGFTTVVRY